MSDITERDSRFTEESTVALLESMGFSFPVTLISEITRSIARLDKVMTQEHVGFSTFTVIERSGGAT